VFSGEEAAGLGVVTRVAEDPLAAARELAAAIAGRSPDAVRAAKKLYDRSWTASLDDGLLLETELQVGLAGTPNQIAAVTAGFTKQPGEFTDPEPASAPAPV
jgi:enoyl-CoA hydratase/carnithine racemase